MEKTFRRVNEKITMITNGEYQIVKKLSSQKYIIKHLECEEEYEIKIERFLSGLSRCRVCSALEKQARKENSEKIKINNRTAYKEQLLLELGNSISKFGFPTSSMFNGKNGLRSLGTYRSNFYGGIGDWISLIDEDLSKEYTRIKHLQSCSKKEAIDLILNFRTNINRPLYYDDFRKVTELPTLSIIKKYWGTVNNMKKEIGLEINIESMVGRTQRIEQIICNTNRVANSVYLQHNRKTLLATDFKSDDNSLNISTLNKKLLEHLGLTLAEYLETIGFHLQKSGSGLMHEFEDGEKTYSQFEKLFSTYLKDMGFVYGETYYRDVKYKEINEKCTNKMNCDYMIINKKDRIYIEIAGILRNYKRFFLENLEIYKKSKEKYRLDLIKKQEYLEDANVKFFILFPCDLTKQNLWNILNGDYESVKNGINSFHKSNINWGSVSENGELEYQEYQYGEQIKYKPIFNSQKGISHVK
ncbi:MAG: hypothetical protein RSB38_07810 [Oscillospiraceae bacterium]